MHDQPLIQALESRAERRAGRRDFFKAAGGLAVGAAAAMALAGEAEAQQMTPSSDADILNFALNLEYLEANFYSYIVNGVPIATNNPTLVTGVGTFGAATGGRQHSFDDPVVRAYAQILVQDELHHIAFIRSQLGAAAIAQPAIDLGTSPTSAFSMAAQSAGAVGAGQSFDPYASDANFLLAAYLFVEVGTSAYQGAAGLISNKTYLDAAAGILAVEAGHAAIANTLIYSKGITMPAQFPTIIADTGKISDARDSLDGPTDDDQPLVMNGQANLVPTDANSLTYPRTSAQVLNEVFLNKQSVMKGGFFPNGVNGTVNTSGANG